MGKSAWVKAIIFFILMSDPTHWGLRNYLSSLTAALMVILCSKYPYRFDRIFIVSDFDLSEFSYVFSILLIMSTKYVCPSTLRCDGKGNSHICLCKSNCQNAVEECSGHNGMSIDITQCSVRTGTMSITTGKEVRWVTTQSGIELGCLDAPSTVKRGSVSCSRGKLDNVTMPICTNLPCKAPPKTMTCDLNNELLDITNNCTCNDNCRKVNIQCRNETWEYDHNICLSPFEKHPFPISDGTTVNITALKQNYSDRFSFKVHCTDDELNVVEPGSATCENGVLNVKKKPICENNSSTFMMNDKYVTIPTAVLGCLLFICIIYVTVKKIQKHRMPLLRAADDEEVLYDEIDLRFAVEPPVPEPPPRVHDGHGYLLVKEPYQYDVVGEEKALEKWIKPIAEVSDDVEQDDVNQDPLSHNAEVPENEDPILHNPEEPEDEDPMLHKPEVPKDENPMLLKPEMPKDVDEKPECPQLEKSEYVDQNKLHRYKTEMPNRPKLPDYVDQNDLEQCQAKISHKPKVFEDVEQNEDKVIRSIEESVNVDEPEFQESKYVDHNDLHRYKVKMPYRPKLPDYVDQNDLEQCQSKISHKPKVFEDVEQNEDKVICSLEESVNVDEPEFQESKYVDHNDLHRYKVKMPYRPKLPDYVDENDFEQR